MMKSKRKKVKCQDNQKLIINQEFWLKKKLSMFMKEVICAHFINIRAVASRFPFLPVI